MYRSQYEKENDPKLSQISSHWIFSNGRNKEFETAMVNEPSVFEPLKFYCIGNVHKGKRRGSGKGEGEEVIVASEIC